MSCPVDLETVVLPHFCLNFKCCESHPPHPTPFLLHLPFFLSFHLKPTAPSIGVPVLHERVCRQTLNHWNGFSWIPSSLFQQAGNYFMFNAN